MPAICPFHTISTSILNDLDFEVSCPFSISMIVAAEWDLPTEHVLPRLFDVTLWNIARSFPDLDLILRFRSWYDNEYKRWAQNSSKKHPKDHNVIMSCAGMCLTLLKQRASMTQGIRCRKRAKRTLSSLPVLVKAALMRKGPLDSISLMSVLVGFLVFQLNVFLGIIPESDIHFFVCDNS